jgi:polyferredoxin
MNTNQWIRQIHRWLAIAFTLGVVTYMVAMSQGQPPMWLGLLPLVPLILLLLTGLYLFVLPYAANWRGGRAARG